MTSAPQQLRAPRGTRDLHGETSRAWGWMEAAFRGLAGRAGFREIRTPIFESTDVFTRGVGEATDIVGKEMYTFLDRKGRSLSLRPEGTAPVVRAVLENGLLQPGAITKLFYIGSMFRYDRPQAGRYRQFDQVGIELIGSPYPAADAEVIALAADMLHAYGLDDATVMVNSVGDAACRPAYEDAIRDAVRPDLAALCPECRVRFETRPLRILDCKVPGCQALAATVPPPRASLCAPCAEHFAEVLSLLDILGVRYRVAGDLVRGLDYYTRTVFEVHYGTMGAQTALFGGGRYDGLVEQLGGPATPSVGYAAGIDRMLLAMSAAGVAPWGEDTLDVAIICGADELRPRAQALARQLRTRWSVDVDVQRRAFGKQLQAAGKRGARLALIFDAKAGDGALALKDMTTGEQIAVDAADVVSAIAAKLAPI